MGWIISVFAFSAIKVVQPQNKQIVCLKNAGTGTNLFGCLSQSIYFPLIVSTNVSAPSSAFLY
jgi:hypothetical protein